ncbi:major facilitator superfamily domain-containing protein [Truncatella angustata]|uniref:Major facilitator superfamily domain-containing protein n=1 Tax=Truncatella angustata TaxID=152316 RepID=A0A9P8RLR8_9PEZI|nr:major facilitator superfamily domain-containing protein [Truncatella angustata]KAH6646396.1 major facilitator superfamily domain-containing protein [Truncatella angustata]
MSSFVIYGIRKFRERQKAKVEQAIPHQSQSYGSSYELVEPNRTAPLNADVATARQTRNQSPETAKGAKENTRIVQDAKKRRNLRYKVLFGLALPFALQSLDTTIMASALPFIAADFNQLQQLNWIISVFNLTSAAFLPFWAQIADVFGRHVTIHTVIIILTIGSAICTGSPTSSFGLLLFGRALQGVGAAGVNVTGHIIMADRVSLEDFAWNWTLSALISAVFFGIGPVVGGYLTQVSWRWCFAINLPIAVAAILFIVILLRKELVGSQPIPEIENLETLPGYRRILARLSTIDYGGQLLFLGGLALLILGLTWAGGSYPWASVQVICPLVIGAVLTITWIVYEYLMSPPRIMSRLFPVQKAMLSWELLLHRDIKLLFFINFTVGMGMFAVMYFMDLYFTLVLGLSSSEAGKYLLYYLPGLAVGAYMAQYSVNTWPRQTFPPLFLGSITSAIGITVLAWATHVGNTSVILGMMALTGHGVGMRMNPGALHGLAYFPTLTAQITCLVSLAIPLGGTVALTIMSTVFNNKSGVDSREAKTGIMYAFISLIPFMWICVAVATFLGNAWILEDRGHEIVHGSYFWSYITGTQLQREKRSRGRHHSLEEDSTQGGYSQHTQTVGT